MIAPINNGNSENDETPGGKGEVADPHLRRDGRLILHAIERGWLDGQRFPTRLRGKELDAEIKAGNDTGINRAMQTAHKLMKSRVHRANGIGATIVVHMEAQNQKDEHHAEGETVIHQHDPADLQRRLLALCDAVHDRRRIEGGNGTTGETGGSNGNGHH